MVLVAACEKGPGHLHNSEQPQQRIIRKRIGIPLREEDKGKLPVVFGFQTFQNLNDGIRNS